MSDPRSWGVGANNRYLKDVVGGNLITNSVPKEQIKFNEVGEDRAPRDARLSTGVGSAAIMQFAVNSDAWYAPATLRVITKGILGGYDLTTNKKYRPYQHPYYPGMYAKDIVNVQEISPNTPLPGNKVYNYAVILLTVSFETPAYPVNLTTPVDSSWNPNWVTIRQKATNQKVTNPIGLYVFEGTLFPAQFGTFKIMPTAWFEMIIHQVNNLKIFDNISPPNLVTKYTPFFGYINSVEWAGAKAESLLLDSMELSEPYYDWLGTQLYNVKVNLIYNDWTWNKQPDPQGILRKMVSVLGAPAPGFVNTPFGTINFKTQVFNALNPIQADPNPS